MAPRTDKPRLSAIDPKALGLRVAHDLLDEIERRSRKLGQGIIVAPTRFRPSDPTTGEAARVEVLRGDALDSALASSDLALTTQDLAHYARTGELGDWAVEDVSEAIGEVLMAVDEEPEIERDAHSELGVVIAAALARVSIAEGEDVPVRRLAALAGVDPGHVGLLGRTGEIEVADGEVKAAEAKRWLGGRGVEGFVPKKRKR